MQQVTIAILIVISLLSGCAIVGNTSSHSDAYWCGYSLESMGGAYESFLKGHSYDDQRYAAIQMWQKGMFDNEAAGHFVASINRVQNYDTAYRDKYGRGPSTVDIAHLLDEFERGCM